jgi:hypothetical protein
MSNNSVPGMMFPTQKGMLAGNPRDSALQQMKNNNASQASIGAAVGGKKRVKKGGDGQVVVPQFQMQYTPQGGPGTDPNAQVAALSKHSTQGTANAAFDKHALSGGSKKNKNKKGGNSNWSWGCHSGGKKSRKHKHKKNKKHNKSRKHSRK